MQCYIDISPMALHWRQGGSAELTSGLKVRQVTVSSCRMVVSPSCTTFGCLHRTHHQRAYVSTVALCPTWIYNLCTL